MGNHHAPKARHALIRERTKMNIGIIGAGNLGTGLTKQLTGKGHAVMLSFSKDMDRLKITAQALGASTGTPAEAVEFADVVALATPWVATAEALRQVGTVSPNKILRHCTE